jgi:hypothetical protein
VLCLPRYAAPHVANILSGTRSHASAFQTLHFDYTAPAPVATAAFLPQRFLLNGQLAPGTPPNARFLPPGQAFDLTLRLVRARVRPPRRCCVGASCSC